MGWDEPILPREKNAVVFIKPCPKRKAAIFTGGLQKAVQNDKKYAFPVAKICKSCFFEQDAQVWCAIILHIDGLHQRCAKVRVARCKKLQYAENTERAMTRRPAKYEEFDTKEVNNL
jgi:hypothetical protein